LIISNNVHIIDPGNLKLTSDKPAVKAGDWFYLTAAFDQETETNAAILTYTYDAKLFHYNGFTPADGVTVLNIVTDEGSVSVTLMAPSYDVTEFGRLLLQAREDAGFNGMLKTFSADAQYVLNGAIKSIAQSKAFTSVKTLGDIQIGSFTLIDLSNIIDMFGADITHSNWYNVYVNWDFNNNNEIDIYDIVFVAQRIQ
jgi:hypothetical protein